MDKKQIIKFYLDQGILISPDLLEKLEEETLPVNSSFAVTSKDTLSISKSVDIKDFERALFLKERHKDTKLYSKFKEYLEDSPKSLEPSTTRNVVPSSGSDSGSDKPSTETTDSQNNISDPDFIEKIIHTTEMKEEEPLFSTSAAREEFLKRNKIQIAASYNEKSRKWAVSDFAGLFNTRYRELEKILKARTELQNLTSIGRLATKKERENTAVIGMVYEKQLTANKNMMITLEDPTGYIKVIINHTKEDLFRLAEEIQLDEVIGVSGMFDKIIFANNLFIPDIPLSKELKKSPEEGYFVVISDTQVGNKLFLDKEFSKFIAWLNGEIGSETQKDIASKVKYIFFPGDLVDGVGIYPDQEYDLTIIDIKDQYKALADYLKEFPKNIPIIFCLGNHDVGRISEPQPPLTAEYAAPLLDLPNLIPVSNPSVVNIFAQPENGFDGFDVMMYHGGSFVYYSNNIPNIRKNGGQKRPDLVMKYLLQRRHLAPSHTSTLYIPESRKDPLLLDKVPDFLFSGHVHRASVSNYKNVTCINASCWVSQSAEQERRGLEAQPARAFIINMQTREVKVMNFLSKEDQDKEEQAANPSTNNNSSTNNNATSATTNENPLLKNRCHQKV